jgi:hypothetical protein
MVARKLYEENIKNFAETAKHEEDLAKVFSIIKNIEEERIKRTLDVIEEACGKYKDSLSSSEDFMKRKAEEKILDEL